MRHEKVIWLAIVISTFIYAGLIYTLAPNPEGTFEAALKRQFTLILYALAVVTFGAALVLPTVMLRNAPARVKMVVGLALFEACVIYGLMAAFLAHDWRLFVPTWIIGLLGMWRLYPSVETGAGPAQA